MDARTIMGRPDYDFSRLMVDYHQAAIGNSELRYRPVATSQPVP